MQNSVDMAGMVSSDRQTEATPMFSRSIHAQPFISLLAIRPGREVNQLKPTRFKVGIVSIQEGCTPKKGRSYWQLRYVDPDTGLDVKRRVSDLSRDEVKSIAEHLTRQAYNGKGYLAAERKAPTLAEGMAQAIRTANTRPATSRDRARQALFFTRWMAKQYPVVQTWEQLRPAMVKDYQTHLERRGLAWDSIRLALAMVKLAWRHMAENYPEHVKPLPKIKLTPRPKREIECLDAEEVDALLGWLRDNSPDLWPMACLQALAGLRVYEAAFLRIQDMDLKAGTVTITDTSQHKPKTVDSERTIPVCHEVIAALQTAMASQAIRPVTGEMFTTMAGTFWSKDSLAQRWRRTLQRAAKALDSPALSETSARKMRTTFATMAGRLDVPERLLKAYMGHSPRDMLGKSYRRITVDELRTVSGRIAERKILLNGSESRKDSGNIC